MRGFGDAGRGVAGWMLAAALVAALIVSGFVVVRLEATAAFSSPDGGRRGDDAMVADAVATPRLRPLMSGRPTSTPTPTATPSKPVAKSAPDPTSTPKPPFDRPADGAVTQGMNVYHPYGVDMGVNVGAEIYAVRDGVVTVAGGDPCCSYGYFIVIEHAEGWTSLYAHLSAFSVGVGDRVQQGQRIGLAGETGFAHGAHLHFELRRDGAPIDPMLYFPPR